MVTWGCNGLHVIGGQQGTLRFLVHCVVSEENEAFQKPLPKMWEEMMSLGSWTSHERESMSFDLPYLNGTSKRIYIKDHKSPLLNAPERLEAESNSLSFEVEG